MSKIKIEDIRKLAEEHQWILLSEQYKNLETELTFQCNEGHQVYLPYKKVRDRWICPICEQNKYAHFENKIVPKNKDKQRILALDQATHNTGYAIFDDQELIYADLFEATGDDEIERNYLIKNWLIQTIQNWRPDVVVIEDIQLQQFQDKMVGVTTYRTLARLQGVLLTTCYEMNVDYVVCAPATWRAHCEVKGRSRADKKRSMQLKVKEWFDISVSDDIADAIGIGKYGSETIKKKVKVFNWE